MKTGKLYGVSVGPGDPELMTLKAVRIIKEADIIAIPAESREKCAAYGIAVKAVPEMEKKKILPVPMPMTRDAGRLKEAHERGIKAVTGLLDNGLDVAFITIGDVGVYSSCQYICQPVKKLGYEVGFISGVPSFCAAAARLGRPLVSGNDSLHVIPSADDDWKKLGGVKVIMKPSAGAFGLEGISENVSGVENCGRENERIFTGAPKPGERLGYYSLFIVGGEENQ